MIPLSDEQRQLYKDRLDDLNTEKQARLEILPQNRKDLQTQVAKIKQTLEKVPEKNTSLAKRIRTLFREQGITVFSILTIFSIFKAVEALPAIVGSVVGAILSFLGKAVRFVAEHTWGLTVFVLGLIGAWLMQKVKKVEAGVDISFFMISLRS